MKNFIFKAKFRGRLKYSEIPGGAVNESKSSAQMQRVQAEKLQYDKEQEEHS